MPWTCPACHTPIRRELIAAGEDAPHPGKVYVCAICHLELICSDDGSHMILAPLEPTADDADAKNRS
jgi:hypothetical protein